MRRTISVAGVCLFAFVVCALAPVLPKSSAQGQENRVFTEIAPIRVAAYKDSPIKVTNLALGDQELVFGRQFDAPDGFLKSLKIQVANQSDKIVTYFSLNLKMQTGNDQALLVPCEFGDTSWKPGKPEVEPPALIKPGQSIWVNLIDGRKSGLDPMESHKAAFALKGDQFQIGVDIVMCEGDSMWRLGYWHNRVAPTQFVPIREGVSLQEGKANLGRALEAKGGQPQQAPAKIQRAAFKSFAPMRSGKRAEGPCAYNWSGSYNAVSCNDMYGQICAYLAQNVTNNGWYNY